MKFRWLTIFLAVCMHPVMDAFGAACTAYSSTSSLTGYTQARTVGDTANCASYTTSYYVDSHTKTYDKVYSCSACTGSSVYKVEQTGGIGNCDYSYSWCSACTYTNTRPNSMSQLSGPSSPTGCATTTNQYVVSSAATGFMQITSCATCMNGYWFNYYYGKLNGCPYTYTTCSRCNPGTYKVDQSCLKCAAGTYSSAPNSSSCTTCPSVTSFYTDSALTTYPSVANKRITSPAGSGASSSCYVLSGRYYDSAGAWNYNGTCSYTGVGTVDECAMVKTACINSNMGLTAQVVQGGDLDAATGGYGVGAACFCGANGRYFLLSVMGQSASSSSTSCENSCSNACASTVANNTTIRDGLGC